MSKTSSETQLLSYLKTVHSNSQSRIISLNNLLNSLKSEVLNINTKIHTQYLTSHQSNSNIDFSNLENQIKTYISKQRENTISSIDNKFNEVNNKIINLIENKNEFYIKLKNNLLEFSEEANNILNEVKNGLENCKENRNLNIKNLLEEMNKEINNIINIINNEKIESEENKDDYINGIQELLLKFIEEFKKHKEENFLFEKKIVGLLENLCFKIEKVKNIKNENNNDNNFIMNNNNNEENYN
jgi:hypothetical protein